MKQLKATIALLLIGILLVLGYSTFIERANGTEYAYQHVYGTLWFTLLWAALTVAATLYYMRAREKAQWTSHLLHASFVVILSGAAVTHFFGTEGNMHLREGITTDCFREQRSNQLMVLPFNVTLKKFHVEYHPGTQAPADFVSSIVLEGNGKEEVVISMNNICTHHGYRFYQASFDADEKGTVLRVSHDPWGIAITYAGYILLALSMLLMLFSRRSEFFKLLNHPQLRQAATVVALIVSLMFGNSASARQIPTINKEKAKLMSRQQVIYNDRVVPFSTPAHEFVQKIYGKSGYKGLSAEQVMVGFGLRPDVWKAEKIILVKDATLRHALHTESKYVSLEELFDNEGNYILSKWMEQTDSSGHTEDAPSRKALMELDEKVGLILMNANQQLFKEVPAGVGRLSERRVSAEIAYNHIPFTKILFMMNLSIGLLLFLFHLLIARNSVARFVNTAATGLLALSLTGIAACYILRWYIAGRIPLGNGYETMLFMALCIMVVAIIGRFALPHISSIIVSFGFLLSGFTLLVAYLGQMNPQITPLMPVLNSPLLSLHVSIIMMAYALLALIALNGIYSLILIGKERLSQRTAKSDNAAINHSPTVLQLTVLSRLLLYPATFLLGIGIFLGAVWANISWGKYWSWDPKEVWALITFMIYGVAFHRRSIAFLQKDFWLHLYLSLAFLTVLMTYFGVNYFLGGMHSYA